MTQEQIIQKAAKKAAGRLDALWLLYASHVSLPMLDEQLEPILQVIKDAIKEATVDLREMEVTA